MIRDDIVLYNVREIPNSKYAMVPNSRIKFKENTFIAKNMLILQYLKWIKVKAFKLEKNNMMMQCVMIMNSNAVDKGKIILFHQTNTTNLGSVFSFLMDMSNYFKMTVLAYEYTSPTMENEIVKNSLLIGEYVDALPGINSVISIGISLGTFASLSMFNIHRVKVRKIVMISPIWFFNRLKMKRSNNNNFDSAKEKLNRILKTIEEKNVHSMVIHGQKDTKLKHFITIQFARKLGNKTIEWYPKNGNHYNMESSHRYKMYQRLKEFFSETPLINDNNLGVDTESYMMSGNFGVVLKSNKYKGSYNENDNEDNDNQGGSKALMESLYISSISHNRNNESINHNEHNYNNKTTEEGSIPHTFEPNNNVCPESISFSFSNQVFHK